MSESITFSFDHKKFPDKSQLPSPSKVPGLAWESLTVSPACAAVQAQAEQAAKPDQSKLRDTLSDLSDDLTAFGLKLPLILVVDCLDDEEAFWTWHQIAGDQDWHRGAFSITPFLAGTNENSEIDDAATLIAHLSDPKSLATTGFKLEQMTAGKYQNLLKDRLDAYLKDIETAHPLEANLYQALIQTINNELRPGGAPERCVERWVDEEVAPWAYIARVIAAKQHA